MSDAQVAQQPEVEVKRFSEAEMRGLEKRMKPYRDAAQGVNEFLDFLKEQHEIKDNEGWQLGDGCFVRRAVPAAKADAPVPAPPLQGGPVNRTQEKERRAKKKVAAERVAKAAKAVAREVAYPNGVPVGDVAL